MAYVLTQPQVMETAAADVAAIGTTINDSTAAAAGRTTGVAAAAADEVSASVADLFNAYVNAEAAGVAVLGAPPRGTTAASTDPYVTFVMGGSGTPTPSPTFVANVVSKYVLPNFPVDIVQALSMPAGEYPDSGIKDLQQNVSIARGVTS